MSDPLDALNLPLAPLAPDPTFAARLRDQIARALAEGDDQGGTMPTPSTSSPISDRSAVTGRSTLSAYLAVADARAAVAWYVDVFGGVPGETVEMPDGRLGHAEVRIGGSTLMLADEFPEMNLLAPPARGGTTVSIVVDVDSVDDVDRTTERARGAGATVEREPADMPYGYRASGVVDPFGHRWLIEAPIDVPESAPAPTADGGATGGAGQANDGRPGDLTYVTYRVRDEQRTAAFLGRLLGWTFTPGRVERGLQIEGSNVLGGLWGGQDTDSIKPMFQVADLVASVSLVREMGGTATEPELMPYGWSSDCADDQGMEFWLYSPEQR